MDRPVSVYDDGLTRAMPKKVRRAGMGSGAWPLLGVPLSFLTLFMGIPMAFVFITASSGSGRSIVSTLSDPLFGSALSRTLLMALTTTLFCTGLGVIYSLAMAMAPKALKTLLGLGIAATFLISLMVRTYGWIILFQPRGIIAQTLQSLGIIDGPLALLQTAPAMYIGMVHIMLPYSVLLTYSAVTNLDANQIKAARSMGASGLTILRKVLLPQISSGIVAGGLLVFMLSLSFYITPAFLGGPTQLTMGTLIGREMGQLYDFKAAAIMGSALFIVVAAVYLAAEKFFKLSLLWERR